MAPLFKDGSVSAPRCVQATCMTPTSFASFAQCTTGLREKVNAALKSYAQFSEGCPAALGEAIQYSLLSPGKRLRPILVLLAAEACGSTIEPAMPAACAVEMVHAYSLIHDDLPAMDDDDFRRGQPTTHKKFGEAVAILAGDALLARAFEVMANNVHPAEVATRCCAALSHAAGATQMVGGQADDLAAQNVPPTAQTDEESQMAKLDSIHRRKTGAMFGASVQLGGVVARANDEQLAALLGYSERLGLAFQIVDDLLDVAGHQADTGKRVRKDLELGKLTFPGLLGIDQSRRQVRQLVEEACRALASFGQRAVHMRSLAWYVVERDR